MTHFSPLAHARAHAYAHAHGHIGSDPETRLFLLARISLTHWHKSRNTPVCCTWQAQTHTRAHARTHTHTHTHTHTNTQHSELEHSIGAPSSPGVQVQAHTKVHTHHAHTCALTHNTHTLTHLSGQADLFEA